MRGKRFASNILFNMVERSADANWLEEKDCPESASDPSTLISIFSMTWRAPN